MHGTIRGVFHQRITSINPNTSCVVAQAPQKGCDRINGSGRSGSVGHKKIITQAAEIVINPHQHIQIIDANALILHTLHEQDPER